MKTELIRRMLLVLGVSTMLVGCGRDELSTATGEPTMAVVSTPTVAPTAPSMLDMAQESAAQAETAAALAPTPSAAVAGLADDQIIAYARVVPLDFVELSFESAGVVSEVLVQEGDLVEQDAPLALLDTRGMALKVDNAKAILSQAKAAYAKLLADGAPQDIVAAQARVDEARLSLSELEQGPKTSSLQKARAAVNQAGANLQTERDRLSAIKTGAQLKLDKAANALRNAQAEYSRIYWENQNQRSLSQEAIDAEEAAERAVQDATTDVEQATLAYHQARQAEITGIAAAEAELSSAQADLEELVNGADADELAGARAALARAEAELAKLVGQQRAQSETVAADLADAWAQVERAEVGLKAAELELDRTTLRAPMAGTIADMRIKPGSLVNPSDPALLLADFSQWRIETDDLTESTVAQVREGAPVRVSFEALPDLELTGSVTRVKPIGQNQQGTSIGDITYTVIITPATWDERLRWNMTAEVLIEAR